MRRSRRCRWGRGFGARRSVGGMLNGPNRRCTGRRSRPASSRPMPSSGEGGSSVCPISRRWVACDKQLVLDFGTCRWRRRHRRLRDRSPQRRAFASGWPTPRSNGFSPRVACIRSAGEETPEPRLHRSSVRSALRRRDPRQQNLGSAVILAGDILTGGRLASQETSIEADPPPVLIRLTVVRALPRPQVGLARLARVKTRRRQARRAWERASAQQRGARRHAPLLYSFLQLSNSTLVPAARLRPGCEIVPAPTRGGRSADRRPGAAAPGWACQTRHARALAKRPASHDAGRAPLGAPPWRFVAVGRVSVSGVSSAARAASSSQPGRSAWRAVPRASRGCGCEPHRGTPLRAPPSGSPQKTPLMSKADGF